MIQLQKLKNLRWEGKFEQNVDRAWSATTVTEVGDKNKKNSRSLWIKRFKTSVPQVLGSFLVKLKGQKVVKKYKISSEQACNGNQEGRVVDPERFVSDSTPDPDPTFKEVSGSAPTSDPATLVSASRELRGKLALYL